MEIEKKQEMTPTRKKDLPVYDHNPFWKPYEVRIGKKRVKMASGLLHTEEEIQPIKVAGVHVIEDKDSDDFVKIYQREMKSLFEIKPSTQKLLVVVLDAIQKAPNSDKIYLSWKHTQAYSEKHNLKISERSFYNSLRELLSKEFLAESTSPNLYWINPHKYFNGDRMVFIKEYRKVARKKAIEQ
jgi:hypothetical protein